MTKNIFHRCLIAGVLMGSALSTGQARAAKVGLDALDEDRVMNELASRRLETLLVREFAVLKVPQDKQDSIRVIITMGRLLDPKSNLSAKERREEMSKLVSGIDAALPTMNDPKSLMGLAANLIRSGVERDVNTLEYWGENPKTQATLRPLVEAVIKILDKTSERAAVAAADAEKKITAPNSPAIRLWTDMTQLTESSKFTRNMVTYYLLLATDAADPKRKKMADEATKSLKEFDNPESTIQATVRNRMAKLAMTKGDFKGAKDLFGSVVSGKDEKGKSIVPSPDMAQQYEARYFSAVCDVLAKDVAGAKQSRDGLQTWQRSHLNDEKAKDGAEAALAMLNYRILSLEADKAPAGEAKNLANNSAIEVLLGLLQKQPSLQTIVFDLLLDRLPAKPDLKALDPLVLHAMMAKAQQEGDKKPQEMDKKAMQNGIAAAAELTGRPNVNPKLLQQAALAVPYLLEKLDKKIDSANGWLDFAVTYGTKDYTKADGALDNAKWLVGQLRQQEKEKGEDPKVSTLYSRFLDVAVNRPFNRTQFAYEYARKLQMQTPHDYAKAATIYRLVPKESKRLVEARYYEMACLKQVLDSEKDASKKTMLVGAIQKRADEIAKLANERLAGATDQEQMRYRSILVNTTLVAADLARLELKDYDRVLKLLDGFENSVVGLSNSSELLGSALFQRVQALMAQEKYNDATQELVKLLNNSGMKIGQGIIYTLLQKLNGDLDAAREAGDIDKMRTLAKNRATLSGFLINWSKNSDKPEVRKNLYIYMRFDASTKSLAADLEQDDTARLASHRAARELYRTLQKPENFKEFVGTLKPEEVKDNEYDPIVALNIGLLSFDIGDMGHDVADYVIAQTNLGRLLFDQKLGKPVIEKNEDGQITQVDNDQYWEALYKLFKSNIILGKDKPELIKQTKTALAEVCIQWGDRVGGTKLKSDFEAMRKDLLPGFDPKAIPTTVPATKPAAAPTTTPAAKK